MKTLFAFLIALLGFGVTLAWSAEAVPTPAAAASQSTAAQRAPTRAAGRTAARTPAVPAFDGRLLQGPAVLCACTRGASRA